MFSLLMTKQGAIGAAIVLALIAGTAWLNGEIRAAEERGQAEEMARVAEINWQAITDSTNEAWAERAATWDSARLALSTKLEDQKGATRVAREGAAQLVLAARSRIRTLADSLQTLTAEDLEVIATGIDSLETAERLCQGALGTCEELVQASDLRLFDVTSERDQALDVGRQLSITVDRLQNLRRPTVGKVGILGWVLAAGFAALTVIQ